MTTASTTTSRPANPSMGLKAMTTYSFTEKKRIRKSFAKRASVLAVPFLLETQLAYVPL